MAKKAKRYSAIMIVRQDTKTYDVASCKEHGNLLMRSSMRLLDDAHSSRRAEARTSRLEAQQYFRTEQVRSKRFLFLLRVLRLKRGRGSWCRLCRRRGSCRKDQKKEASSTLIQ